MFVFFYTYLCDFQYKISIIILITITRDILSKKDMRKKLEKGT